MFLFVVRLIFNRRNNLLYVRDYTITLNRAEEIIESTIQIPTKIDSSVISICNSLIDILIRIRITYDITILFRTIFLSVSPSLNLTH